MSSAECNGLPDGGKKRKKVEKTSIREENRPGANDYTLSGGGGASQGKGDKKTASRNETS